MLLGCVAQEAKEKESDELETPRDAIDNEGVVSINSSGIGSLVSKSLTPRTIVLTGAAKYKIKHVNSTSCTQVDFSGVTEQSSGVFSFTPTADDVNIICAVGIDSNGIMSLVASSEVLTIDLNLPTLFVDSTGLGSSPSNNTANRTITYTGSSKYKVLHRVSSTCTGADFSARPFTVATSFTFTPVNNQDNIICVVGYNSDNVATPIVSSDLLTIDTIVPVITVHSTGLGPSPASSLLARSIIALGADTYKFLRRTGTDCTGVNLGPVVAQGNVFSFNPLGNVDNIVCVQGFDHAGNQSTIKASSVLTTDTIAPVISLSTSHGASPSNDTTDRTITVSGASFYKYIRKTGTDCTGLDFSAVTKTASTSYTYTPVNNQNNIVCVQGQDIAGNNSNIIFTSVLLIDTVAPSVPNLALYSPSITYGVDDTPTLRVTNGGANDTVEVFSDNSCTTLLSTATYVSNPLDITLATVNLGPNSFYALSTDLAGNASNCSSGISYQRNVLFNDPLFSESWYMNNIGQKSFSNASGRSGEDINANNAWNLGATGNSIKIAVSDQPVDVNHPDLAANMLPLQSMDYTVSDVTNGVPSTPTGSEMHGTAVAGIIGAVANNSIGSHGVAYESSIATLNLLGSGVTQTLAVMLNQASGDFDIFNYSYGSSYGCRYNYTNSTYESLLAAHTGDTVTTPGALRAGKGATYIKSAGNSFIDTFYLSICNEVPAKQINNGFDYTYLGNANLGAENHLPYMMIVGAYNSNGVKSSYSSIGSNLWISAPGGEYGLSTGYAYPQPHGLHPNEFNMNGAAMITTDLPGCVNGSSESTGSAAYQFNLGDSSSDSNIIGKNSNCDYTNSMNGTSSAAPSLTGVVALMLDANPALNWRDVKHILAVTAKNPGNDITNTYFNLPPKGHPLRYVAGGRPTTISGRDFQRDWVINAAGYYFHNWYGFGKVDAGEAVKMALNYTEDLKTYTSFLTAIDSPALVITDPTAGSPVVPTPVSHTFSVVRPNFFVENVELSLNITHPYVGDLGIEITSPSGTISQVLYVNSGVSDVDYLGTRFLSNAFYGEPAAGNWKIEIIDGAIGDTGTLDDIQLKFFGHDL